MNISTEHNTLMNRIRFQFKKFDVPMTILYEFSLLVHYGGVYLYIIIITGTKKNKKNIGHVK